MPAATPAGGPSTPTVTPSSRLASALGGSDCRGWNDSVRAPWARSGSSAEAGKAPEVWSTTASCHLRGTPVRVSASSAIWSSGTASTTSGTPGRSLRRSVPMPAPSTRARSWAGPSVRLTTARMG